MNIFNDPFIRTYDNELSYIELCNLEASEKITELSRQVRSYLNYRIATIRMRYSDSQMAPNIHQINSIKKWEAKLSSSFSQYSKLLRNIGLQNGTIRDKIFLLRINTINQPNKRNLNLLRDIKCLGDDLWKILHVLSELEIQLKPQLLKIAIGIANVLCETVSEFYSTFSDFYQELKINYQQLEEELEDLLQVRKNQRFNINNKSNREMLIG